MPQALPLVAGFVVGNIGATALAAYGIIGVGLAASAATAFIGGLVAFGVSKAMGLDAPEQQRAPGPEINIRGATTPIPILYGRRRIACSFVQIVATGQVREAVGGFFGNQTRYTFSNQFLNVIGVWGEGEIDGIETIYFDDDIAWTSLDNVTVNSSYTPSGTVRVRNYAGTDDQEASADFLTELQKLVPARDPDRYWTANHRLRGVAYSWLRLGYSAEAYPGGLPAIVGLVRGRKVLDVRDGVWRWSKNPALCIYDYLTNERFGRGIPPADIDTASFIEAANYCDEQVFIPYETQVEGQPITGEQRTRYECDAILNPENTPLDNTRALLTSCRGMLIFSGGTYKLRCDKPEPATFDLTEDNIVGGWNIALETLQDRLNRVVAQFPNRNTKYLEDMRIVESAAFRATDGRMLELRVDLPCTTDQFHAAQLAGIAMRQSRYMTRVELTATIAALEIEVGDVVRVTHETPGWNQKAFRVMAFERTPENDVRLQLQEYAAEVYDVTSANNQDSEPDTLLPDPRTITAVQFFEIFSLVRTVNGVEEPYWYLVWFPTDGDLNVETYVLQWRLSTDQQWNVVEFSATSPTGRLSPDSEFRAHEVPRMWGMTYVFQVFAINRLGLAGAVTESTITSGGGAVPAAPTALRAASAAAGCRVTWAYTQAAGVFVDLRRHATPSGSPAADFNQSVPIARLQASAHEDGGEALGRICHYWVQTVDTSKGTASAWVGPVTAIVGLQTYADDTAAIAAGLISGDLYQTPSGDVRVVA